MAKTILALSANPRNMDRLQLHKEVKGIRYALSHRHRRFQVIERRSIQVAELQDQLWRHKPKIVHFCGHGETDGLFFENEAGDFQKVSSQALGQLFRLFKARGVECVVLNACYSESIAEEVSQHIDYVIGMSRDILDRAAIAFSNGFYRALAEGQSYRNAYLFGCNNIALEAVDEKAIPKIKYLNQKPAENVLIEIQWKGMQAISQADLRRTLSQLRNFISTYPQNREGKKLFRRLYQIAGSKRTPTGLLAALASAGIYPWMTLGFWLFWSGVFYPIAAEQKLSQHLVVFGLLCTIGGFVSHVLYRLAWYSLRSSGTWHQNLTKSLLLNSYESWVRIILSYVIWLFLTELLLKYDQGYGFSFLGIVIGLACGITMSLLLIWQISLMPSAKSTRGYK